MPSPTAADIFATFPEFATADPADISLYLTLAEANQADLWGDVRYQQAIAYRAGCDMWQAGLGTGGASASSGGGQVTSKRIGSLAISYAAPSSASGAGGTLPDNPYCNLLSQLVAGAVVPITVSDLTAPCCGADGGNAQGPWDWGSAPFAWRRWWP